MTIFNPLDHISLAPQASTSSTAEEPSLELVSMSGSFSNAVPGICPKCGAAMTTATTHDDLEVYWCGTCRVSYPMPNKV